MAVSIAVNWTPPASSPLFDDDSAATTSTSLSTSPSPAQSQSPAQGQGQTQTADGQPSSSSASASPSASPSSAPLSSPPATTANASKSTLAVPAAIPGRTTSPQPRSYAAAAASSPSQSSQQSISPPASIQRTPSATSSHSPQQRSISQPQTSQQQSQSQPQQPLQQQQPQHSPHHSQHQQQHPQQAWAQPPQSQQPPQMPQPAFAGSRNQNMFGPPPQQHPPHHGHNGAGFGPAYNMAFAPPAMPNQFAWAQYQQMLAAQAHSFYGQAPASDLGIGSADPSGRRRTTSGPQRPAPLTYNDTFHQQAYPGVPSYATAGGRGNLPPGAMAPPTGPSAAAPGNSFHPYRRQPRPSDPVTQSPNQFGQQGSSSGAGSQLAAPSPQLRTRASSTASHDSASRREATAAPALPTQTASYSAAASGSLRSQSSNVGAGAAPAPARSGPARQGSYSTATAPDGTALPAPPAPTFNIKRPEPPSRTESSKSTSSTSAAANTGTPGSETSSPHSRSDSVSSQSSVNSTTVSDKASTIGGRTTPTPGSKKPSPLSRPAPPEDDDDDTNAEYGGSDREDGTPDAAGRATPSGDKKKGLGGKLRKALSLHSMNEVQQQHALDPSRGNAAARPRPSAAPSGRMPAGFAPSPSIAHDPNGSASDSLRSSSPTRPSDFAVPGLAGSSAASISSRRSGRPPLSGSAEGSGKRSLFNRKFNSSTDNISISSTVSSASVMLRKVGNLGKIARRHSLMGLTNMFNKDKEGGRDGLQSDDFGTMGSSADGEGDDGANANGTGKLKKNKKGKSAPVAASVSHATVELDPNGDGMTPAAHYVRQHQLQMRQQAEAEAKAARERQEAEARAAAAAASAAAKNKGKTTDDVVESRQKMIEKEKERLKSKRGWRNRLRVGGGSSIDQTAAPTGLETIPYPDGNEHDGDVPPGASQGAYQQQIPYSPGANGSTGPVPQLELGQDFGGGFDDEELEPPHMPAAGGMGSGGEDSGDEFETDSLRHWGEGIERSRASAALVKAPKGILKKSVSSSQLDQSFATGAVIERPFAGRLRANSYDAPQSTAPGAPMLSAMSTTTAGAARMDGLTRSGSLSDKDKTADAQQQQQQQNNPRSSPVAPPTPAPVLGHHSNSSMPTLTLMTNPTAGAGGTVPRPSMQKKRICFTEEHIYHSTWPAHVYDRRGELATCNRLTPLLAQRIKEELNSYKMEEMEVAPSSRIYTHFFV